MMACGEIQRTLRVNATYKNLLQGKTKRHKTSNCITNLSTPPYFLPRVTVPLTTVCGISLFSLRSKPALDIAVGLESTIL